jgi:Copper transport outer membrane protein, MctB
LFDFRYHALSLAAVLLALAVGVVIGVAIGDSDLVSSAKSGIVHDLKEEVGQAQQHASKLSGELNAEQTFANDLYPIAVHGLLGGQSVGVVFLGGSSNRINGLIRDAVTQAGGNLGTVVAVHEPLDLAGIAKAAKGTRFQALAPASTEASEASSGGAAAAVAPPEPELLEGFGKIVGKQLVSGGANVERELISRVRARLLTAFDGQLGKLDEVVIVRNEPTTLTSEQSKSAGEFDSGLIAGIAAVGIPIVGVELSNAEPSQISWYQSKDLSSVDDLDTTAGQAALVYALTGSQGSFGTKPTADSLLPNVVGASAQP